MIPADATLSPSVLLIYAARGAAAHADYHLVPWVQEVVRDLVEVQRTRYPDAPAAVAELWRRLDAWDGSAAQSRAICDDALDLCACDGRPAFERTWHLAEEAHRIHAERHIWADAHGRAPECFEAWSHAAACFARLAVAGAPDAVVWRYIAALVGRLATEVES